MSEAIKPHGTIKATEGGSAHIPKEIRESLESDSLPYVMDAHTVVLFNPNSSPEIVLKSLQNLIEDIKLRVVPKTELTENDKKVKKNANGTD